MTRNIVSNSPHREVGIINPGWLLDHPVHHESHLERRFVMAALACPVVMDIVHQPVQITLDGTDGKQYTPDYHLKLADGAGVYVEVKPEVFLKQHAIALGAAKATFTGAGEKYLIITDKHIDKNELGQRAILLMRYARMHFSVEQARECMDLIESMAAQQSSIRTLIDQGLSEALIWNLVARHQLVVPPAMHMKPEATVTNLCNKENCHDQLCAWFGIAEQ